MTQAKERPILFSAPMVRAILSGQKTVTRREVKKPAALDCLAAGFEPAFLALPGNADLCPYGKVGDRLWVREAWQADAQVNEVAPRELSHGEPIRYPADGASRQTGCSMITPGKTRPSIHMPRWVSRLLLEITAVRVERLQDISEEQAKAEGVRLYTDHAALGDWWHVEGIETYSADPRKSFELLWTSVGGDWKANPWVWVFEFKRVTP
ncbi:hypothetical protein [Pseudomonas viridiflava]|uniref:hypothetical protein n=1 Tax=Pseudomonas viridiflava TaxID=33069 RepID=UPI000F05E685|nr:hypothetical protein [Pseudomonas viridiflava]